MINKNFSNYKKDPVHIKIISNNKGLNRQGRRTPVKIKKLK